MNAKHTSFACLLLASLIAAPSFAEVAPDSVKALGPALAEWGHNTIVVAAVKEHNDKKITLDEIKERDAEWKGFTGVSDFMSSMLTNAAAMELKALEGSKAYFTEVFLMGNLGANVAMTNKTSDYWQGDEAKFTESFKGGTGAVHYGNVKFDKSAQAYLVQVSVPVWEGDHAIGAITIGVNLDKLEASGS